MKIGIIGAGKMGCALGIALKQKGFSVSGIYSKNASSAAFLNTKIESNFKNDLAETVKNSEVVFITVPDTALHIVASDIESQVGHLDICWKTFLHCSGALTSDVLDRIRVQGGYTGSFHPIQTFADKDNGWAGLEGIFFGFEGCAEAKNNAQRIANAFNGMMLVIDKQNKPLYHAAACVLSNYVVTLSWVAGKLLEKAGINSDTGINAFMPLIERTVRNIGNLGSINALTGPISRGDSGVIAGHVKALRESSPEFTEVYKALGKATVELALAKGSISKEDGDKIFKVLI